MMRPWSGRRWKMATATRGGRRDGTIFHSDRGAEGGFNRSSQHLENPEVRDGTR